MSIILGILTWCGSVVTAVKPFLPGFMVAIGWTTGSHVIAFGGSWWSARRYSINCIGEGLSGLYNSYWTMGSATCTTLLFSHVSLIGVAIASMLASLAIFGLIFYKFAKRLLLPVYNEIKSEIKPQTVSDN